MRSAYYGVVAIAIFAAGCKKADPYVGTWKATYSNSGTNYDITQTNLADGTYTTHMRVTRNNVVRALIVDDRGTWKKQSETSVEERITDTNWTSEGGTAAAKAKAAERFSKNKSRIIAESNKEPVKKLKWDGNDRYTESESIQSITFHRVP